MARFGIHAWLSHIFLILSVVFRSATIFSAGMENILFRCINNLRRLSHVPASIKV